MITRSAPLLVVLSTLVGWALFLGILSGRPELFIAAVPLMVALLSARRPDKLAELQVTTELSSIRLVEGDRLTLSVTLVSQVSVPLIEILLPLPPTLTPSSTGAWLVTSLRSGEKLQHSFNLRSIACGQASVGRLQIRISDHSGLCFREIQAGTSVEVYVFPRILRVRHLPRPERMRSSFGNHVGAQSGAGLEHSDVRPFIPGDRIRQVNWPASLRRSQLYVTQFHEDRNADVVLLLDTLAETGARPNSSLDVCGRAAAALATAYVARKDRVGLIEYGGYLRWIKPASGRIHLERLLGAILPAEVVFTYVARNVDLLPRHVLPPQALVIAISPLIDDRFTDAAVDLVRRGYDVLILAVCPIELTRRALRASPLTDVACRLWAVERQARLNLLRHRGLSVIQWDPLEPLETALNSGWSRRPSRRVG